jgi:hypothetical protein
MTSRLRGPLGLLEVMQSLSSSTTVQDTTSRCLEGSTKTVKTNRAENGVYVANCVGMTDRNARAKRGESGQTHHVNVWVWLHGIPAYALNRSRTFAAKHLPVQLLNSQNSFLPLSMMVLRDSRRQSGPIWIVTEAWGDMLKQFP